MSSGWPATRSTIPPTGAAGHLRTPRPQDDPLYAARRIRHTGAGLLTDGQRQLTDLFAADEHVQVEAT